MNFNISFIVLLIWTSVSGTNVRKINNLNDEDSSFDATRSRRRLDIKIEGYGYTCTGYEIKNITRSEPSRHSSCPSRNWLGPFIESIQSISKTPTFIIVGCNKGDDFVSIANKLSGNNKYDVNAYRSKLSELKTEFVCNEKEQKIENFKIPKTVFGYCIEPVPSNIELIKKLFNEMKLDEKTLQIVTMAMNSYTGTATFPKDVPIGFERAGIETDGGGEIVHMSNLDTFVINNKISDIIDFVSIDTEGYDAEVLLGFSKTLVNKYVRVIEFEYHSYRRWKTADLQMIITMLDIWNYDCYWQGDKDQLWRITGCWHRDYYKKRFWSNIVCINRKETNHKWFVNESQKYM